MLDDPTGYFVYVYRDRDGNPAYFAQGLRALRPADHFENSHNRKFSDWIAEQGDQYRVEIIGPLGSQIMADAIETALISACLPSKALERSFFNVSRGLSQYRFRPYGVPEAFASRITLRIGAPEFEKAGKEFGPILFVRINQHTPDVGNAAPGYDLANPPSDEQILARVVGWWQIGRFLPLWQANPELSPALLVGVTGGPSSQVIISSSEIDRARWDQVQVREHGLVQVPVVGTGIDAARLRGHGIDSKFGLRFDRARHAFFRIFDEGGFRLPEKK